MRRANICFPFRLVGAVAALNRDLVCARRIRRKRPPGGICGEWRPQQERRRRVAHAIQLAGCSMGPAGPDPFWYSTVPNAALQYGRISDRYSIS